jgi:uncharacterized protein YbbC (DUF1343 family)
MRKARGIADNDWNSLASFVECSTDMEQPLVKMMRKFLCMILAFIILPIPSRGGEPVVKTGIEVLRDRGFDVLRGKRVGLITNPTGVDASLNSTIDIIAAAPGAKLVALFGPEHGVRGDFAAGDKVETAIDKRTGVPAYSLYGATRKPTPEMLKGIDILVYDIQDNGCRSYTYISTMGKVMEAAAEQKIPVVVLDRPNPLGGKRVEGNLVEPGWESFVGQYAIPYVYGLTCGELARMLNGEGILAGGVRCELQVVPMKGWQRTMTFDQTGLPWVPASPHIPRATSSMFYACTGVLGELGVISEGVGYTLPFELLAAEWIDPMKMAERMNALNVAGVIFRPISFKPFYGKSTGKQLHGVQIHITDERAVDLLGLQFLFMQVHQQLYPGKNPFLLADSSRIRMFDKVMGTDKVRKMFTRRMSYEDLRGWFADEARAFTKRAEKYWLYK